MKTFIVRIKDNQELHSYEVCYEVPEYDEYNRLVRWANHTIKRQGINAISAFENALPSNAKLKYVKKDNVKVLNFTSRHKGEEYSRGTLSDLYGI